MQQKIREIAAKAAIVVFFAMTGIGLYTNVPPEICCIRSFTGSIFVYIVFMIAGKIILSVIISAIAQEQEKRRQQQQESED